MKPRPSSKYKSLMHYFLIDGYNLCFRCFYAMPELTRADGFPTGALHAFVGSVIKLCSMDAPHASAVFFDKGGSARHRELYPEYKANRSAMPEAMRLQMPEIKRLCGLLNFVIIEREGVEADDLLASAAVKLKEKAPLTTIVSADKDFAQLVGPRIRQLLPPPPKTQDWVCIDSLGVKTKFGVSAAEIPCYLALMGDSIDNIPGLDGVGPKTAAKWIKDFGDLETILRRHDWVKPEKFRTIIAENEEKLRRNLKLVTLDTALEVPDFSDSPQTPQFDAVLAFLEEMGMKRGIAQFKKFAKEQYQKDI